MKKYWSDTTFNESAIPACYKPCALKEAPYDDYTRIHNLLTGRMGILEGT